MQEQEIRWIASLELINLSLAEADKALNEILGVAPEPLGAEEPVSAGLQGELTRRIQYALSETMKLKEKAQCILERF